MLPIVFPKYHSASDPETIADDSSIARVFARASHMPRCCFPHASTLLSEKAVSQPMSLQGHSGQKAFLPTVALSKLRRKSGLNRQTDNRSFRNQRIRFAAQRDRSHRFFPELPHSNGIRCTSYLRCCLLYRGDLRHDHFPERWYSGIAGQTACKDSCVFTGKPRLTLHHTTAFTTAT